MGHDRLDFTLNGVKCVRRPDGNIAFGAMNMDGIRFLTRFAETLGDGWIISRLLDNTVYMIQEGDYADRNIHS